MTNRDGSSSRLPREAEVSHPLYSVSDLDIFKHDPAVEEFLSDMYIRGPNDPDPESPTAFVSAQISYDSDPRVKPDLMSVTLPPREIVIPQVPSQDSQVPEPIQALYRFKELLQVRRISAKDLYRDLRIHTVELSESLPPRGHMDGGSLVNTTDRRDCLWGYRVYTPEEIQNSPHLKVANGQIHRPIGDRIFESTV